MSCTDVAKVTGQHLLFISKHKIAVGVSKVPTAYIDIRD